MVIAASILACGATAATSGPHEENVPSVEVRSATDRPLRGNPGNVLTAVFSVRNPSRDTRRFTAEADLPEGWLLITSLQNFSVAGGETVRRLISFRVGDRAPVGRYDIRYRVREAGSPGSSDEGVVSVTVGQVDDINIQVVSSPEKVVAGDRYELRFLLTNAGNASVTFRLAAGVIPESPVSLDHPPDGSLGHGGQLVLTATVEAPDRIHRPQRQWFRLRVLTAVGVAGEVATSVDVLPAQSVETTRGRFPVLARINAYSSYRGTGGQLEVEGRGIIRDGGTDVVDFGLRTPDGSTSSLFARRDEYRVSWIRESWALMAGDHVFALSPLTEFGRRGRGAGAVFSRAGFNATAFVTRSRYAVPRETVAGVGLAYDIRPGARVGLNVIDKTGSVRGTSATFRTEVSPVPGVALDAEFGDAGGFDDRTRAYGFAVRAGGEYGSIEGRTTRSGRDFPGVHPGYASTDMSFVLLPPGNLRFEGSLRQDERRFLSSGFAGSSASSRDFRVGPSWAGKLLLGAGRVAFRFKHQSYRTTHADQAQNRWRNAGELEVNWRTSRLGIQATAERAYVATVPGVESKPSSRFELSGRIDLDVVVLRVGAELQTGAALHRPAARESMLMAFGAEGTLRDLRWQVDAFAMIDNSLGLQRYHSVSSRLSYMLPSGHRLVARSNLSGFGAGNSRYGYDVSVAYEVPISVPTRGKMAQMVRGRVVDGLTGAGVEGAVLRVGSRSFRTNGKGEFSAPLPDGDGQYLFLESRSIGLSRVPLVETPIELTADVATQPIEIPVAPASSASGTVTRFVDSSGFLQQGVLTAQGPESGVVVELTDGVGRVRATSGPDGRFSARNLRPGTWTARIVYANLPADFAAGEPTTVFLQPGVAGEIELRVVPKKRTIRFVARGRVAAAADSTGLPPDRRSVVPADSSVVPADSSVVPADSGVVPEAARDSTGINDRVDAEASCAGSSALPALHVVSSGESLSLLARQYYCDYELWPRVWFANLDRIDDPHRIDPGVVLAVPQPGAALGLDSIREIGAERLHVAVTGEALEDLAWLYYGDRSMWPRIWMANRVVLDDDTKTRPGLVLIIPGDERHAGERQILD